MATPKLLILAGDGIGPQCNPRYTEFIDFIVLNDEAARQKIDGSFFETTFSGAREHHPSDHCPIAVDLIWPG